MLNEKKVLKWLIIFNLTLVLLYLITNHFIKVPSWTVRHWFDLNDEANIPTWFSSIQLFLISVLSILYSIQAGNKHLRHFYYLIGFVFLFFSVDEVSEIHEGITSILIKLSIHSFFPKSHGLWIIVYFIILFILGLIFWRGLLAFWNEKKY